MGSAVLFARDYTPRPGLVAGTYAGATAFERGLRLFGAGERPSRLRLLLPVNVSDEELGAGFAILEQALRAVAKERGVRC